MSNNKPPEQKPSPQKPSGSWGLNAAQFLSGRRDQPLRVALLDSKVLSGVLVGVDQYNVFLRQNSDMVVMIPKHTLKYCHALPPVGNE